MLNKLKKGISEYKQTIKELIITFTIMLVAWVILGLLNYIGVESKLLMPLNFLTASLNGFQGNGVFGMIGGFIAKITLLMMITKMIIPMVKNRRDKTKKTTFKEKFDSIKEIFNKVFEKGIKLIGFIILGVGIALVIYAFLSVNGNFENSFVIILALIATLKILVAQTGVIIRTFTLAFRLTTVSNLPVYSFLIGLSFGFTISVSLAVIFGSAILAYILGAVISVLGIIFIVTQKNMKPEY